METCLQIFKLKFERSQSNRNIAVALGVSPSTVYEVLSRFKAASLSWPLPDTLSPEQLEKMLFPARGTPVTGLIAPDWLYIDTELRRQGVTRQLLWMEYSAETGEMALGYSQFCRSYLKWKKCQKRSMRQTHRAGEKLFIDFCGPTVPVIDPDTGDVRRVAIFVAVMGASNYTYVEACPGQDMMSWLNANSHCLTFLGGVPDLLIPDNLRSAVKTADRYEPVINDSYQALASHYGTVVMPTRPYKPKDKAKAENGVLLVERWLLARIRNETFHSVHALNVRLRELMTELNNRPMKGYGGQSRAQRFALLDAPALNPLPSIAYEYSEYRAVKVAPDYHVEYDRHWYSVPHELVGERLTVKAGQTLVQVWHKGRCVAQHPRSDRQYSHTTHPAHMPVNHRGHSSWSPEKLLDNAARIGNAVRRVAEAMLNAKPHQEQAYRAVLGLLSLQKKYGAERLEKACSKACELGHPERRFIDNLLRHNREDTVETGNKNKELKLPQEHANLRGAKYYH